jgi:hypothetical protein
LSLDERRIFAAKLQNKGALLDITNFNFAKGKKGIE